MPVARRKPLTKKQRRAAAARMDQQDAIRLTDCHVESRRERIIAAHKAVRFMADEDWNLIRTYRNVEELPADVLDRLMDQYRADLLRAMKGEG